MLYAVWATRLGEVDSPPRIQPNLTVLNSGSPLKRTLSGVLASGVQLLTTELAQMKSLLLTLQPRAGKIETSDPPPVSEPVPDEDVISVSANLFTEYSNERPSHASGPGSRSSAHGLSMEEVDYSRGSVICRALACQQLDIRQLELPAHAFFCHIFYPSLRRISEGVARMLESDGRTLAPSRTWQNAALGACHRLSRQLHAS